MSEVFDYVEYRNSVLSAWDGVITAYKWLLITCASLIVFAFQSEPYQGSKESLLRLTELKTEIDEKTGSISAFQEINSRGEGYALGESINELQNEKVQLLTDLHILIKGGEENRDQLFEEILDDKSHKLNEKKITTELNEERSKLFQFGVSSGLKLPFFDFVIERERFPALVSTLTAVVELVVLIAVLNLHGAVFQFLSEAERSGQGKKAAHMLSIRWMSLITSTTTRSRYTINAVIVLAHSLPFWLVVYAVSMSLSSSEPKLVLAMLACMGMCGFAAIQCSRLWIQLGHRVVHQQLAAENIAG